MFVVVMKLRLEYDRVALSATRDIVDVVNGLASPIALAETIAAASTRSKRLGRPKRTSGVLQHSYSTFC